LAYLPKRCHWSHIRELCKTWHIHLLVHLLSRHAQIHNFMDCVLYHTPQHTYTKKETNLEIISYRTTLVALTLIILFSELLIFFLIQIKKICEGKYWIFKNNLFFKIKISKLINYSTNMCWTCQGTMVHTNVRQVPIWFL
jgi:hypothetical protein